MAHLIHDDNGLFILVDQWYVEDVEAVRKDLSREQCETVLEAIAQNHDANIGINWEVITYMAEELFPLPEEQED